jgi:hydrogenase maturation protease
MNRDLAIKIADAVLYEGYMLYPYRRSALKNRQRWSFGILYPPDYEEVLAGTERSWMHSECLLKTNGSCNLSIQLRFLLSVTQIAVSHSSDNSDEVKERWDEAVPRSVEFEPDLNIAQPQRSHFSFSANTWMCEAPTQMKVVSKQHQVQGVLTFRTETLAHNLQKISMHVANDTQTASIERDRDRALCRALLSAHLILHTNKGEFVSLLEPPEEFRAHIRGCQNIGNFPVLLGGAGEHGMMLCSPIILYDYPQVAPESAGDFYDATEMDEMLTLRLITLTDEEKNQVRSAGDRARALLERTEQSAREQLMRTHGVIRNLRDLRQAE